MEPKEAEDSFENPGTIHMECYCDEDQGCGYTYSDEYGPCHSCEPKEDCDDCNGR